MIEIAPGSELCDDAQALRGFVVEGVLVADDVAAAHTRKDADFV